MNLNFMAENFDNWAPIRLYRENGRPMVDWCYLGDERFVDPFFDDTIARCLRSPFNKLFRRQTPLDFLAELADKVPVVPPSGFIFHLSRCGSTLAAQMLAALSANIVISEAPPISKILESNIYDPQITDERRIEWLRAMIAAFARRRFAGERCFFVKFDSWNIADLGLIERAFPDVPWIFLYREPVEVIVSQMRVRGMQMIPAMLGHLLPELSPEQSYQMPAEEYCARVLARFCEHALAHGRSKNGLFVNYTQLPGAVTGAIVGHFGVSYDAAELEAMNRAAQFDAKTPQLNFVPDSEKKRREASEPAIRAAEKWVAPLYEKLEAARRRQ